MIPIALACISKIQLLNGEPTMKHTLALATLCAAFASASVVNAKEAPLGQLTSVTGNVSVGGSNFINKAKSGTPLFAGNTVLVATNAKATIVMADGCTIQLAPAQHLRVTPGIKCSQLQASVKQLFSPYQVAQAPVPGSSPVTAPPGTPVLAAGQVSAAPLLPALSVLPAVSSTLSVLGVSWINNQTPTSGS
jgi:hypothetical protein